MKKDRIQRLFLNLQKALVEEKTEYEVTWNGRRQVIRLEVKYRL